MIKYVTKRERKIANSRALKIVKNLQEYLSPKYKIDPKLVGSGRYNAVVCDENGIYDMDYQLILTNNCKCKTFNANTIRKDFFNALNEIKNENEKIENSTSVITVRVSNNKGKFQMKNEQFSFDFAIIIENDEGSFITRRDAENHYTWNQLPSKNSDIYKKFYSLKYDKQKVIIEKVINRKIKEKAKPKEQRIPSSVIFMEEVNNYRVKNEN